MKMNFFSLEVLQARVKAFMQKNPQKREMEMSLFGLSFADM